MKSRYTNVPHFDNLYEKWLASPTFKTLIQHLQTFPWDTKEISVDQLQRSMTDAGLTVSYNEARAMLKMLEGYFIGGFKIGRRGHPSRFIFHADEDIASLAALIPVWGTVKAKRSEPPALEVPEAAVSGGTDEQYIVHKLWLRPNLEIAIELPSDFNEKDALRLSEFLKTLPFSPSALGIAA